MIGQAGMYDFDSFTMSRMIEHGAALRRMGVDAASMQEVAERIVDYLRAIFSDPLTDESACALVRLYKTHRLCELEPDVRDLAMSQLDGDGPNDDVRCLTLMATRGDEPAWNDRRLSVGHRVIPLPSSSVVHSLPMVSQLLQQLGLDVDAVVAPDPSHLLGLSEQSFGVFFEETASQSPYIPVQEEFVARYRIRSALGFGGVLPSADVFTVILFSHSRISRQVAERFETLALQVKLALLPFAGGPTFTDG